MTDYLTMARTATRTRLDASTVGKWRKRGAFPGSKRVLVRGYWRWLIPVVAVQRFNARRPGK